MSIRRTSGLVGAVSLALILTGCGSSSDDGGGSDSAGKGKTRVFAADNGKITIPSDPKRVVATGYAVASPHRGRRAPRRDLVVEARRADDEQGGPRRVQEAHQGRG